MNARLMAGKMLLETDRGEDALNEYKLALALDQNSIVAILGIGLALSQSGDPKNFEEAKPYLKRFVEEAPDTHPMKRDIEATLGDSDSKIVKR